jgi:hypothetical protein
VGKHLVVKWGLLTLVMLNIWACTTLDEIGEAIEDRLDAGKQTSGEIVEQQKAAESLPTNPCATVLTGEEQRLYDLIMDYRKQEDLPRIPLSPSLSYVAKVHVRDLQAHPPSGRCNGHSWSENGSWTACCYTGDHARAQCMWDKPRELTDYQGNGYEIASWGSAGNTADQALAGWKTSSGHNSVIINKGQWSRSSWKAVGVGVYGNWAVVWFGKDEDPCQR